MLIKRKYTDVHGNTRELVKVEICNYLVQWNKELPAGPATRWQDEHGGILQIPDNVWDRLSINYEDIIDYQ